VRRRDLLAGVGGAATFPSFVAAAADKPFRVGVVSLVNGRSSPQFVAFEQRLRELASATGQDLTIDFTVLDGDAERFAAAMQEQVQRGVDVLLAPGQEVALKAAQAATQTIPIVMVAIELPTRFKLVVNLTMTKALDLTLPPLILSQADEVIE
jgi:putative tryptophan/tyrosine transport system substrate-binding protein